MSTMSVNVPPTSIPIRIKPPGQRANNPMRTMSQSDPQSNQVSVPNGIVHCTWTHRIADDILFVCREFECVDQFLTRFTRPSDDDRVSREDDFIPFQIKDHHCIDADFLDLYCSHRLNS